MVLGVLLCFAVPAVWVLYAILARREMVPYIFLFLCLSLLSAVAASGIQALTQPLFSKVVIFSGGLTGLALHSFVQAGLIEEACKAAFFFLALRRVFANSKEVYGIREAVAFSFAVFFGSLFASFETLGGLFYLPGAAVTRMFTAHVLHPAAMLISASGAFFGKGRAISCILSCLAAVAVHGFYNFTVGTRGLFGAVVYTAGALILAAVLWAVVFGRAYPSSRKSARTKKKERLKKPQSVDNSV